MYLCQSPAAGAVREGVLEVAPFELPAPTICSTHYADRAERALLDGHCLGQVARLVNVASKPDRDVVGEKLQRNRHEHRSDLG